jgi:hypothetical protein
VGVPGLGVRVKVGGSGVRVDVGGGVGLNGVDVGGNGVMGVGVGKGVISVGVAVGVAPITLQSTPTMVAGRK